MSEYYNLEDLPPVNLNETKVSIKVTDLTNGRVIFANDYVCDGVISLIKSIEAKFPEYWKYSIAWYTQAVYATPRHFSAT